VVLRAAQKSGKPLSLFVLATCLAVEAVLNLPATNCGRSGNRYHPDICRYHDPEAVQLVLQAVIGHGGEVFMLNMGQPVKIVDLAKDLIRLRI